MSCEDFGKILILVEVSGLLLIKINGRKLHLICNLHPLTLFNNVKSGAANQQSLLLEKNLKVPLRKIYEMLRMNKNYLMSLQRNRFYFWNITLILKTLMKGLKFRWGKKVVCQTSSKCSMGSVMIFISTALQYFCTQQIFTSFRKPSSFHCIGESSEKDVIKMLFFWNKTCLENIQEEII